MLNHLLIQEGATHPLTAPTYLRRERYPHHTTLHYATAASHPPEYASHPTSERGRSLFRGANLYAHSAHVWVKVCTGCWCACVRGREFRNEGRIYGLAGLDFSPRSSSGPPSRRCASPSDFLAGIPFRSSDMGSRPSCLTSPAPTAAVRCGWLDDALIRVWYIPINSPIEITSFKSVNFWLFSAKKILDDATRLLINHLQVWGNLTYVPC